MDENFNLLIAYDGSESSDAALDDLKKLGLPENEVNAMILSIAEVWLPPQNKEAEKIEFATEKLRKKYEEKLEKLKEAGKFAKNAEERVRLMFPNWNIKSEATYGSPAWEILAYADKLKAELIVAGAKGRSAIERVLIGSISQKVLTEAECSVRVARGKVEVDESPTRIIIGYDGTDGANEVIKEVTGRNWKGNTQFKIVIVEDSMFVRSTLEIEEKKIIEVGNQIVQNLNDAGFETELVVDEGNPKEILVNEADKWDADCIFIGATQHNDILSKYLLGSVASAVATRANCSVEVIRPMSYSNGDE